MTIEVNDSDFELIKTMPLYQFRRWLEEYFEESGLKEKAYNEGYEEGYEEGNEDAEKEQDSFEEVEQETAEDILSNIQEVIHQFRDARDDIIILRIKEEIKELCEKYKVSFDIKEVEE